MQRALIGPHVNDWVGAAIGDVQQIHGGDILKCLTPNMPALTTYAVNSPGSIVVARQYFEGPHDLSAWRTRCDHIVAIWGDAVRNGLVTAVETPYNEVDKSYGQLMPVLRDCAGYLRDKMPGVKIVGLNDGVGNPANLYADWEIIAPYLQYFDYLGLHEYAYPDFDSDNGHDRPALGDGRKAGYWWLRYRFVYAWLHQNGFSPPPLVLTEFGIDRDGNGSGWRSLGLSPDQFALMLANAAIEMGRDSFFAGAALFCHGAFDQEDWGTYDSVGESAIVNLYNTVWTSAYVDSVPLPDFHPTEEREAPPAVLPPSYTRVPGWVPAELSGLYYQWRNTDGNTHPVGTEDERNAFWEHAHETGTDVSKYGIVLEPT